MRVLSLLLAIALGVAAGWMWRAQRGAPAPTTGAPASASSAAPHDRPAASSPPRLTLEPAARELADIATTPALATEVDVEQYTTGRVLDAGALLAALRERRAARDAVHAQEALLASQRARLERLRGFAARGEIGVTRELNALEVSVGREADVAARRAAQLTQVDAGLRARWGASLADSDGLGASLADGASQLVEFAAAQPGADVYVARDEQRAAARRAEVLGAAPAALGSATSATWVARVADPALRVGMRVGVWVPQADARVRGVLVPAAAIVWQGGAQWYYIETAAGEFERRKLGDASRHALGIVVHAGLEAGAAVVVRGAQALLAEELRQRIPSEDDDD